MQRVLRTQRPATTPSCRRTENTPRNPRNKKPFEHNLKLNQDSNKNYVLALKYINKYHNLLNKELKYLYSKRKLDRHEEFYCPVIPNYAAMVSMVFHGSKECKRDTKGTKGSDENLLVRVKVEENQNESRNSKITTVTVIEPLNLLEYNKKKKSNSSNSETQISINNNNNSNTNCKKVINMFNAVSGGNNCKRSNNNESEDCCDWPNDAKKEAVVDVRNEETHERQRHSNLFVPVPENPLKLHERDLINVNKSVLRAIGLFDSKGGVKRSVMDLIEKRERAAAIANDARTKRFRCRRQIGVDLSIEMNDIDESSTSNCVANRGDSCSSYSDVKIQVQNAD